MLQVVEASSIDAAHAGYFFRQVWIIVDGGGLDEFSNRALYTAICGTGATAVVSPATQNNPCPLTIKLIGYITGAPGSHVTYRFIGNGLPWSPPHHGVIPPSGVLQVVEASSIDAAHAGYFFRQVWIVANSGGLDEFSNRALYTAVCGTLDIAPPMNFTRTLDPKACGDHVEPRLAGALCGEALAGGRAVFTWSWQPVGCFHTPCLTAVDGYRIYRLAGKAEHLVLAQMGQSPTATALARNASGLVGDCYTVRAFRGYDESPSSNQSCVQAGKLESLVHVVLRPVTLSRAGGLTIIKFDLSALSDFAIWTAKLELSASPAGAVDRRSRSCDAEIYLATADPGARSSLPAVPYVALSLTPFDVTSAVRAWVQRTRPNYGFVLRTADEMKGRDPSACRPPNSKPALSVDYVPS